MSDGPIKTTEAIQLTRIDQGKSTSLVDDLVTIEEPLEIRIKGKSIVITMRTPGYDEELATGFLLSEQVIQSHQDILEISHCTRAEVERSENILNVFLSPEVSLDLEKLTHHVFASSSCGLCGKASIEAITCVVPALSDGPTIPTSLLHQIPDKLSAAQIDFARTGGLHAVALLNPNGELLACREDIGRHNAVDKITGWAIRENTPESEMAILAISGRASFEIIQKAAIARIPIVTAVSAPSSLAISLAHEVGITLIGFHRNQRFNVYSHPKRVHCSDHP